VQAFTWFGLLNVWFEPDFFLAFVTFLSSNSFTFLREKWWILAPECLVKVFDAMEWGFVWEFVFWNFEKMKKMVIVLELDSAPFLVSLGSDLHWI
jgi:hypothetical protein